MIVVADTSPLNYLILLGYPEILEAIYGEVVAPSAVLAEMQHPDAPADVRAWAMAPPFWLRQVSVKHLDESLATSLGVGEREAISLALELGADVLLIDDMDGRRQAEARHISITGTLTVLLQASLRGYCDFPEALRELRSCGFWFSESTEAFMMRRYEEGKRKDR